MRKQEMLQNGLVTVRNGRITPSEALLAVDESTIFLGSLVVEPPVFIRTGSVIGADAWLNQGALIGEHTYLDSSVSLGSHARVGSAAYLAPRVYMGDLATVGARARINEEIRMPMEARLGDDAILPVYKALQVRGPFGYLQRMMTVHGSGGGPRYSIPALEYYDRANVRHPATSISYGLLERIMAQDRDIGIHGSTADFEVTAEDYRPLLANGDLYRMGEEVQVAYDEAVHRGIVADLQARALHVRDSLDHD